MESSEFFKKRRFTDVELLVSDFYWWNHRLNQNDSLVQWRDWFIVKMTTESPRDSKWQIHTVTCWFFHQNSRRTHRWIIPLVKPSEKVNICPLCRPSPHLFLLLLPNPNSPHLQTTSPQTKISLISAQQVIFLEVLWSQHPCSDLPMDFINFCK